MPQPAAKALFRPAPGSTTPHAVSATHRCLRANRDCAQHTWSAAIAAARTQHRHANASIPPALRLHTTRAAVSLLSARLRSADAAALSARKAALSCCRRCEAAATRMPALRVSQRACCEAWLCAAAHCCTHARTSPTTPPCSWSPAPLPSDLAA
eukprot:2770885-Rhodomonas_salina.2